MKMTSYEKLIYISKYARWSEELGRREEWNESVARYHEYMFDKAVKDLNKSCKEEFNEAVEGIRSMQVMPSMRALWTAGPALDADNLASYNCSYLPINSIRAFAELMYILMNGSGVGFSVERQYVNQLPNVPHEIGTREDKPIVFADSKRGWAEGFLKFIRGLFAGERRPYDLSKIRPKGARLKTFGGRASGPEVLEFVLGKVDEIITSAAGRKLNSLECHDICCWVAEVVIAGGVRRSACISLSNLSDDRMAKAKSGDWFRTNPQRSWANNSVAYTEKPDTRKLISEWLKLIESQSGERGIFNRQSADITSAITGRISGYDWGINPCGEVILRPNGLCNLTEVVIRPDDTEKVLLDKVRWATILGCVQSTLTNFKFVNRQWKLNAEEERLLGVSLTGLRDHPVLGTMSEKARKMLAHMRMEAKSVAKRWAGILGINEPAAITCVKPSGTVSQLVNCSSGLHPRYAPYYIRRVRLDTTDPISKMLVDQGIPYQEDPLNLANLVFEFPIESPECSVMRDQVSAYEQLDYWFMLKQYWCDHNPSCTIYVREEEWTTVLAWVDRWWNMIGGLSFLPYDSGSYQLTPYEEIDEDTYLRLKSQFPGVDFSKLSEYEEEDLTTGNSEFACQGDNCEL